MTIMKRGSTFHLRKRVPVQYQDVEPRKTFYMSLSTDSETVARQKAPALWQQQIEYWEALQAGDTVDAERRYEAAQRLAKARGFRFLSAGEVAKLPLHEILERGEAAMDATGALMPKQTAAFLGGAREPQITVSRALELYWELAKDRTQGKSADQLRRWENPRKKAVKNFIDVVGDKVLNTISPDDMLDFRSWWMERLEEEGLAPDSANKDLIHLGDVLKTVNKMKRLGLVLPLSDLAFKKAEAKQRPPFSTGWIRDKLLAPGALDGLNNEARCILLGMVNTGYRPSEGAALTAATIRLDSNVPHISIEPEGRQLKSVYARRVIPLAGVSLEAFRECAEGFPRYRESSASLSATVNKYLPENDLLESDKHSLYSLRHAFEDRMLAAGIDDRIRRDLFGHRLDRERYGKGASLEHLHDLIQRVAI
ncbi:MAG: DUF6538 domain-containing protein [Pseudomonadota bacterium]